MARHSGHNAWAQRIMFCALAITFISEARGAEVNFQREASGGVLLKYAEVGISLTPTRQNAQLKIYLTPKQGYIWHSCENKPMSITLKLPENWHAQKKSKRLNVMGAQNKLTAIFDVRRNSEPINNSFGGELALLIAVRAQTVATDAKPEFLFEEANIKLELNAVSGPLFTAEEILEDDLHIIPLNAADAGGSNRVSSMPISPISSASPSTITEGGSGAPLLPSIFLALGTLLALLMVGLGVLRQSKK